MKSAVVILAAAAALGFAGTALADAKATFEAKCAECHEATEFAGKPAADLEKALKGIAAGSVKHKPKFTVSDAEAKELATFLAGK